MIPHRLLGKTSRKNAVLLDFVQIRGGGLKQVFCLYLLRILDNESFEKFLAFKKVVQVVQIAGRVGRGEVIWTKSERTGCLPLG